MSLCDRCVFNDMNDRTLRPECIKHFDGFPHRQVCTTFISKASNVALLGSKKEENPPVKVEPLIPKTKWEIYSTSEPEKCVFFAHLPTL